ncbi:MAG TPA: DPP IV N-terminal domain-containing protein, partial [Pyrinomonadaceae bacterium]|nr:DPP IV N-terminal domain-containing protein [Pyrinomonadaceae bacterium]
MLSKKINAFCLFTFAFCLVLSARAQNSLTVRDIMREPSPAGMRPDAERLSPDGRRIIFAWNAEGREPRNLYIVNSDGGEPRILVNAEQNFEARTPPQPESKLNYGLIVRDDFVRAREKNLGGVEFSPDSRRILFLQNTDIYVLDLEAKDAKPRRITRTQGTESAARWLTNDGILYQSGGNFFVLNLRETSLVQVTKEANPQAFITIFNASAAEDGRLLAYVVSDGSRQRALFVPNYLDEFTQAPATRRGFTEQKVYVAPTDGSREKPFEINLPKAEGASFIRSLKWAADNASLLVDRVDKDTKRRQLFLVHNVGGKAERTILVTEETDAKWIAPLSRIVEPNPKNVSQILFASEKDGFNHLYLATLERAQPQPNPSGEIRQENASDAGFTTNVSIKQLTRGNFEIDWAKWTAGGESFIFSSTEENSAERQFYAFSTRTSDKAPVYSVEKGMKTNPQIDKTGGQPTLLYGFSQWKQPTELYAVKVCPGCRGLAIPRQITKSTPEGF